MASCLNQTSLAHLKSTLPNFSVRGRRLQVQLVFFYNDFSLHTRRTTSPQYEIWDFTHAR